MNAYNAKIKGNEGPKGQKLENGAGPGAVKFFVWEIGKTDHFWQLGGNPTSWPPKEPKCKEVKAHKAKMKERPTRPKCKEMKAHKAKMQGNERPQGQNERK